MSDHLHIVVLILAAGADMGAFYQVIARAMGDSSEFFVFLVLIGFTATVLYLGHVIGLTLRNHKAKYDTASLAAVAFCVFVLAGLGAALGAVAGAVPGVAAVRALQQDSVAGDWPLVVPWTSLLLIAVAAPLVAGLLVALFTRSRLPVVHRRDA